MHWQDLIIALALIITGYAVPVMIWKKAKVPFKGSAAMTVGLLMIGVADVSLGFWVSAVLTFANAVGWAYLAEQATINRAKCEVATVPHRVHQQWRNDKHGAA